MKTVTFLCLLVFGIQGAYATHLLGGYIQVKPVAGSALTYEVVATIYYEAQTPATEQATSISLCFGDGISSVAQRQNQQILRLTGSLSSGINISTYRINHTYVGPGTYAITAALLNRSNSQNITNRTIQEPLTLTTTFSTISAINQTPTLSIPATGFEVATNQRVVFPFQATDADGDSLVYGLVKPLTSNASDLCSYHFVTSYLFPNDLTHQGTFKLNNRTGDLTWDTPTQQGYFSVAVTIAEYRNGVLLSQTTEEIPLIVEDKPGTPGIIPPYEPAIEGAILTALTEYHDENVTFTAFPNPVDDRLQVVIQTANPAKATIQLIDMSGRKLHELSFDRSARQHEQLIGMGSLSPGLYMLRADIDGQAMMLKIVKK